MHSKPLICCSTPRKDQHNRDSEYQVIVKVMKYEPDNVNGTEVYKVEKKVHAKRQQVFYVNLDNLTALDPFDRHEFQISDSSYGLRFRLKGPNTQSAELLNEDEEKELNTTVEGITIFSRHHVNHLTGLLFRKC